MRLTLCLVILLAAPTFAAEKPRLGVMLVVDQLSAEAFRVRLPKASAGFKRLTSEGATFYECRFEAAPTVTSPGHATLATGAYAETHGVVANEWIDAETGKKRLSTEDPAYLVVGRDPQRDGTAPTWLRAPTLADAVAGHAEGAKALSISGKDRSAILTAGRAALALWFDAERPLFTTSTFYAPELPAWVTPTNEKLAKLLLQGAFAWGLPAGGVTGKAPSLPPARQGDSEPFAEQPQLQPIVDTAEIDLALDGVKALSLGKDEAPDLLTISFSGHDRIGHRFGPDSPEALKEFLHLDAEIGRLLTGLDAAVGKGKYVVALVSDHGVPNVSEVSKSRGLDAGRVDTYALKDALEKELDASLGAADWIAGYKTPGYTLNPQVRLKALPQAYARLRKVAQQHPGVLDLLLGSELSKAGSLGRLYANGYFEGRSPDLIIVTKPYWTYGLDDPTGHASAYLYDRAVPLVFFGAGVAKASLGNAEAIDVAPTLAKLLNVPPPPAARGHAIDAVFR